MSVVHRHSLAAAGLVCLAALTALPASAQGRAAQPNADTPRILIATFRTRGTDARAGVEGAEAVRNRVQREFRPQDLFVIPRERMNEYLLQSGYRPTPPSASTTSSSSRRTSAPTRSSTEWFRKRRRASS